MRAHFFVVTTPPSLPTIASLVFLACNRRTILLVHDVYPDALAAAALLKRETVAYRILDRIQRWTLSRMSGIIVLGRDMQERVKKKLGPRPPCVSIIPNWGDTENITPAHRHNNPLRRELGLAGNFLLQFSGNLGRTQAVTAIIQLAAALRQDSRVKFLVFGSGAGLPLLQKEATDRQLTNILILPRCTTEQLPIYLTACDLFVLPLAPGMAGVSVPSRMYNVMAAGSPILGICEPTSEVSVVIEEERIGWCVAPQDVNGMVVAVNEAMSDRQSLLGMGRRARHAAEKKYSKTKCLQMYEDFILQQINARPPS